MDEPERLTIHGYLEVRRGPATVPGSVEVLLPHNVRACAVLLKDVQAWNLVARLIVALEGTEHLSDGQAAALLSLFEPARAKGRAGLGGAQDPGGGGGGPER